MCKPGKRSFITNIWCSYILRGLMIVSQIGAVVVTFVPVSVSGKGPSGFDSVMVQSFLSCRVFIIYF